MYHGDVALILSISNLIELWQWKVKADSERLQAGDTVCWRLFVGQDVGFNSTRSVESDWLPDEKVI
jgi:hypothetical protein